MGIETSGAINNDAFQHAIDRDRKKTANIKKLLQVLADKTYADTFTTVEQYRSMLYEYVKEINLAS